MVGIVLSAFRDSLNSFSQWLSYVTKLSVLIYRWSNRSTEVMYLGQDTSMVKLVNSWSCNFEYRQIWVRACFLNSAVGGHLLIFTMEISKHWKYWKPMWSICQQWEEGPSPGSSLSWVFYLNPRGNSCSPHDLLLCSLEFPPLVITPVSHYKGHFFIWNFPCSNHGVFCLTVGLG